MTLNIRGMIFSKISVSLQTISSATLSTKSKMRFNLSNRFEGIWSYLFCSFKSYKANVIFASSMPGASTNLKCDAGKTEDSLRDWI